MGVTPLAVNLPIFVAQHKNFFKNNGLEVEFVSFKEGSQVTNALFADKIDGGLAAIPNLLTAQSATKKIKFRIAAVQIEEKNNPVYKLIVPKKISNIHDLEGKKIGYFPTSPAAQVALSTLLEKYKVKTEKIQFSGATLIPALEIGSVDAIFSIDPQTTIAENKKIGTSLFHNEDIVAESMNIIPLPVSSYILSSNLVHEHPDIAQKVVKSLNQAIDFIRSNPDEARKIMKSYLPQQQKNLISSFPIVSNWKSSEIQVDKIKAYQQLLLDKKVLKKPVSINDLLIK